MFDVETNIWLLSSSFIIFIALWIIGEASPNHEIDGGKVIKQLDPKYGTNYLLVKTHNGDIVEVSCNSKMWRKAKEGDDIGFNIFCHWIFKWPLIHKAFTLRDSEGTKGWDDGYYPENIVRRQ